MSNTRSRDAQYLDDLRSLLGDLEPSERAEVLDAVREHIASAVADLGHEPQDSDLTEILRGLGSPAAVASAALAERSSGLPATAPAPGGANGPTIPTLARAWVPPAVVLSIVAGGIFAWLLVPIVLLLAGIVVLCASPLWTIPQKIAGALVAPLALASTIATGLLVFVTGPESESNTSAISPVLIIPILFVLGISVMIWLWVVGAKAVTRFEWPALSGR